VGRNIIYVYDATGTKSSIWPAPPPPRTNNSNSTSACSRVSWEGCAHFRLLSFLYRQAYWKTPANSVKYRRVISVYIHPSYDKAKRIFDLSLIKVRTWWMVHIPLYVYLRCPSSRLFRLFIVIKCTVITLITAQKSIQTSRTFRWTVVKNVQKRRRTELRCCRDRRTQWTWLQGTCSRKVRPYRLSDSEIQVSTTNCRSVIFYRPGTIVFKYNFLT